MLEDLKRTITQFHNLYQALIDASSIIYMNKAGFLNKLNQFLELFSLPEIIAETGYEIPEIKLVHYPNSPFKSSDQKLVAVAIAKKLPVISEDKKLLLKIKQESLPYFNALMMLNFLVLKKIIDKNEYFDYLEKLKQIARYNQKVWEYGHDVFLRIVKLLDE